MFSLTANQQDAKIPFLKSGEEEKTFEKQVTLPNESTVTEYLLPKHRLNLANSLTRFKEYVPKSNEELEEEFWDTVKNDFEC